LESIIANDYPEDRLEVLVVDGASEDRTREVVAGYTREHPWVQLLDNPRRVTPAALNVGIRQARGSIVMRMDAHSDYEPAYVSKCVRALQEWSADNVGGAWVIVPRQPTLVGEAIVKALAHAFGIGNARYRGARGAPSWVDTVPYFCCRRALFDEVGFFNEELARGQDMEFSRRLLSGGKRTLLVPEIVSYYHARSDLKSFVKHNWTNGVWAILPFMHSSVVPVSARHLVPLAFVGSVLGSAILAIRLRPFRALLALVLGSYAAADLTASAHVAWRERKPSYLLVMPWIFGLLHAGYGAGSFWGVIRLLSAPAFWQRLRRIRRAKPRRNGRDVSTSATRATVSPRSRETISSRAPPGSSLLLRPCSGDTSKDAASPGR
jgi:GT2 family glycosyltransferase